MKTKILIALAAVYLVAVAVWALGPLPGADNYINIGLTSGSPRVNIAGANFHVDGTSIFDSTASFGSAATFSSTAAFGDTTSFTGLATFGSATFTGTVTLPATTTTASSSKTLVDNTATNFVNVSIPQTAGSNWAGGLISYVIFCKDASNQAQQEGSVKFACMNLAGTESCGFGTPDGVTLGDGTASLGTPVFTAAGGTDAVAVSVQSDCTGVTPTTDTLKYRVVMEQSNMVTPQ